MKKVYASLLFLFSLSGFVAATNAQERLTIRGNGRFGNSLASFGNDILIGAPFEGAGAVSLFDGVTGDELRTFPNLQGVDQFGFSLAVSGNQVLIGAPVANLGAQNAGEAYLFDGTTGALLRTFPNVEPSDDDFFGFSVALEGNSVVIGAPNAGTDNGIHGAVYLFDASTGEWLRTFRNPDQNQQMGDQFGFSVAILDSGILIGAPLAADSSGVIAGAAFLFEMDSDAPRTTFRNPTPEEDDGFGFAVATLADSVLIGTPGDDSLASDAGAVYVFNASTGERRRTFVKPEANASAEFGHSVVAFGNDVIIGSPGNVDVVSGSVFVFNGATGEPRFSFSDPTPSAVGRFGYSLAAANHEVIVGEPFDEGGAVYVFPIEPTHDIVINEILYDPNYDDLEPIEIEGRERIELKNVGAESIRIDNWRLQVAHQEADTLTTFWRFPDSVQIAPQGLLTIHWLAEGTDDSGNLFTGLPDPNDPNNRFSGNNSASASQMTIGGHANNTAFALCLQEFTPGSNPAFVGTVDFVQVGSAIPAVDTLAEKEGLWDPGTFVPFIQEGQSLELVGQPPEHPRTRPEDYVVRGKPSIGVEMQSRSLQEKHLLISEVCVRPRIGEFVEIFNPTDSTIVLTDYYLTDHVNLQGQDYTSLVRGEQALSLSSGDFLVKFPAGATIEPDSFQTVAFRGDWFGDRYQRALNYEIIDSTGAENMVTLATGQGEPRFDDSNEALILFKWSSADSSDLVEDVDYVIWGEFPPGFFVPFRTLDTNAGENPETVPLAGPLNEAVDKTGFGIDGMDGNSVPSYYNNDTLDSLQTPVANQAHASLKSWQRRPGVTGRPGEFGELRAGGNGISGHDETSENLAVAFREEVPTPNEGFTQPDNQFDVVIDTAKVSEIKILGLPNGLANPGDSLNVDITLRNESPVSTGKLFAVLRSLDRFTTVTDSTVAYNSIATGDTASSLGSFAISVARDSLPDSLSFVLRVIQKQPSAEKQQVLLSVKEIFLPFKVPAGNVIYEGVFSPLIRRTVSDKDTLLFNFSFTNSEDSRSRAPETIVEIFQIDNTAVEEIVGPSEKTFGNLEIGDSTEKDSFKLVLLTSFSEQPSFLELLFTYKEGGRRTRKFKHRVPFNQPESISISGKVSYYFDQEGVDVSIDTATVILDCPGLSDTTKTDMFGDYNFEVSFASDKTDACSCTLRVEYSFIPEGAITLEDVGIAETLAGNPNSASTPFQLVAADVNRNDEITTCPGGVKSDCGEPLDPACVEDVALLLRRACSSTQKFWTTDWRFINALLMIDNTNWRESPDTVFTNLRHYNITGLDFTGVLLGDLDGNWLPEANERRLATDIQRSPQALPEHFELNQNFPNPFNPTTRIRFQLPVDSEVRITVMNMLGQIVNRLVSEHLEAGYHETLWLGTNQYGNPVASGVYLLQMKAGDFIQHKKMLLIR